MSDQSEPSRGSAAASPAASPAARLLAEELKAEIILQKFDEIEHRLRDQVSGLTARLEAIEARQLPVAPGLVHVFDRFYVELENRFRGSESEIADRLRVYLPVVAAANSVGDGAPLLDIGCGRGEWLRLLKAAGLPARGVDLNTVSVRSCRERGLDVIEADAIACLRARRDSALGAITAFHVIEHLPFAALLELFREASRVLVPGGLLIVETPNPTNVTVGSNTFYLDPTHRKPLPAALVKFSAESQGLSRVSIMGLHPWPREALLGGSPVAERFNENFYGDQDYAVIGYRA